MKRTNFRWAIIALLFSLNIISYIDRSAMAYAVKDIMASLHLNFTEMGSILGAFGIGYLITTFFSGIVVDRFGSRLVVLLLTLLWVIAIASTGAAIGFVSLYLARFALGVGEGPNFPAVARTVSDWLPQAARAKALSNSLVAVPLSLALSGAVVTLLLVATNWRWMFVILALVMLIWWPCWFIFYRNKPAESPYVNQAELDYISEDNTPESSHSAHKGNIWKFFISSPTLLSNNWGFFVFGYAAFFYLNWLPDLLEKSYQLNIKQAGLFTFLPWALSALFLWVTGYLSDFILKRTGRLRYARSYPIILGQFFGVLCMLPILYSHNLVIILISISLAVAFNFSNNTAFYATNIDVAKHRAGTSLGVMNSGVAIAAFLAPFTTGWLVNRTGSFHSAFVFMAVLMLSSVLVAFFFHRPDKEVFS